MLILYFFLNNLINPDFTRYQYKFMIDKNKLKQLEYSTIQALNYVFQIIGSIKFEQFFQNSEPRHTVFYNIFIFIIQDIMNYMFTFRMNLEIEISDFIFEFIKIGFLSNLENTILYFSIFSFLRN